MDLECETRRVRETSIGWRIQRIAGAINRRMRDELAPLGLDQRQFAVLMTALEHEGLTQAEIGARFEMPAYAISRALDQLEGHGLVERGAHPTSRRAVTVRVTEAGRNLAPRLFDVVRRVNADLVAGLDDAQRRALGDILEQLAPRAP